MKLNKIFLGFASVLIGFSSCEPIEEVGPSLCPSSDFSFSEGDLELYRVGKTEVDLASVNNVLPLDSTGLHLVADFGEDVSWELKLSNGSLEKNYSGSGSSFDIYWYGTPDKFNGQNVSFGAGDVTLELDVICQETITKTIKLTGKQTFTNTHPSFGFLARDWDKNGKYPVRNDNYTFFDGAPFVSGNTAAEGRVFDYFEETSSPFGGKYLKFVYYSGIGPSWYFGDYAVEMKDFQNLLATENCDSIYVNVFVNKVKGHDNVPANFGMRDSTNQGFLVNEDISWDGWKLLSYKLSDLRSTINNAPLSDLGSVKSFLINFGASPSQSESTGCKYDMVLFTVGAPLFE